MIQPTSVSLVTFPHSSSGLCRLGSQNGQSPVPRARPTQMLLGFQTSLALSTLQADWSPLILQQSDIKRPESPGTPTPVAGQSSSFTVARPPGANAVRWVILANGMGAVADVSLTPTRYQPSISALDSRYVSGVWLTSHLFPFTPNSPSRLPASSTHDRISVLSIPL